MMVCQERKEQMHKEWKEGGEVTRDELFAIKKLFCVKYKLFGANIICLIILAIYGLPVS